MGRLMWNDPSSRQLFGGTDRGVLYLPDRAGIPWDGITSVVQTNTIEAESLYFDGRRFAIDTTPGAFEGTLSAFNYPVEFERAQGFEEVRPGVYANSQRPITFGLTYRTSVRNASGLEIGHKIHLFWDLKATPSDVTHNTLGGDPEVTPFSWDVLGMATELGGILPTGHLVLNTTEIDPWLIEEVENLIYGSLASDASLPDLKVFYAWLMNWARFYITDHGDGTWTGTEARSGHIQPEVDGDVPLENVDVTFLDADTFEIEPTYNVYEMANMSITQINEIVSFNTSDPNAITTTDPVNGIVDLDKIDVVALSDTDVRISVTNNPR